MVTTTVVWPQTGETQNPTESEIVFLNQYIATLVPNFADETTFTLNNNGTEIVVTRTWPSQETAQQWVDYVLANFTVASAVINS